MLGQIGLDAQVRCVRRELAFRRSVYPRWVAAGKMRKLDADNELAVMQAVLETLEHLSGRERITQNSMDDLWQKGKKET